MSARHFFLTGMPSIGKTTVLLRTIQSLGSAYGFVTQAAERDGKRTGLNIVTSNHSEFNVASVNSISAHRTGKYAIDIAALNRAVQNILDNSKRTRYVYIDEIGTLYCQSPFFTKSVRSLFESHIVIGVIARKGHAFIEEIHHRPDCCFLEVTAENRDDLPGMIIEEIEPS